MVIFKKKVGLYGSDCQKCVLIDKYLDFVLLSDLLFFNLMFPSKKIVNLMTPAHMAITHRYSWLAGAATYDTTNNHRQRSAGSREPAPQQPRFATFKNICIGQKSMA